MKKNLIIVICFIALVSCQTDDNIYEFEAEVKNFMLWDGPIGESRSGDIIDSAKMKIDYDSGIVMFELPDGGVIITHLNYLDENVVIHPEKEQQEIIRKQFNE